jgi:DNA-binding transcriptional LysR family regulator
MGFINLDIDLLRTFVTAVEAGSFAQAGRIVGRTPSAVSLQINRLEQLTSQQLFTRQGRRHELTAAGERIFSYARRMLALNDETVKALEIAQESEEIRIGIPEELANACLPRILIRFALEKPETLIQVQSDRSTAMLSALDRGELDIALAFGHEERREATRVANLPMTWIGNSHHDGRRILNPVPLVLFSPPCVFRTAALEVLDRAGLAWKIVVESSNLLAQSAAVEAGLGISVRSLPGSPADLVALGLEDGLPSLGTVPLTLHVGFRCSPPVAALRDQLLNMLPARP